MSANTPGLKQNWRQFSLLVLINAFVGGMVGLERTILPEIAETDFGIAARSAIFSGIIADQFDLSYAITLMGILTLFSAIWIVIRMNKLNK